MRLAIVTSGFLPVPAVSGGAVENLIENFLNKNEEYKKIEITIFSIYDNRAFTESKKYNQAEFDFIKPNILVKCADKIIYFIAKNILRKEKTMSFRYICQRLYFLNKVSKKIKKSDRYDKILLENHPTLFMCLKKRKNYKKYEGRYYYHLHNEISNAYGCIDLIKNCKNNICVSQFILNQLSNFLKVKNPYNFSVLKNCVDQKNFQKKLNNEEKNEVRKKYNINEQEKVLLFTGRFTKEKGIKELILALKKVKNKNYKLLVVGSFFFGTNIKNGFQLELEQLIENMRDKVVFTGYVPYDEIYKLYAIADISTLPSVWDDPAPLTIIEALSCGLPIITTYSGGIPEYVNERCAIILKRNEDLIENLAKSIDNLLENDNLRINMGQESLKVSKQLTVDNYYFNFLKLLE